MDKMLKKIRDRDQELVNYWQGIQSKKKKLTKGKRVQRLVDAIFRKRESIREPMEY